MHVHGAVRFAVVTVEGGAVDLNSAGAFVGDLRRKPVFQRRADTSLNIEPML